MKKILLSLIFAGMMLLNMGATYQSSFKYWRDANYNYSYSEQVLPNEMGGDVLAQMDKIYDIVASMKRSGMDVTITQPWSNKIVTVLKTPAARNGVPTLNYTVTTYTFSEDRYKTVKITILIKEDRWDGQAETPHSQAQTNNAIQPTAPTYTPSSPNYTYSYPGKNGYTIYHGGWNGYSYQGKNGYTIYQRY